jgi:hypothetical protein
MLGPEHRNKERRAFRLSTPLQPFSPAAGSKPQDSPQTASLSEPVARDGLSLAYNGCPFRSLHSRVNGPGLPLRADVRQIHHPFGLKLHDLFRFAPDKAASLLQARCGCISRRLRPLFQPPLPSGTVTSLGINAFGWTGCRLARLPTRPISVRSPPPILLLGPASDHRSRSATFRRLAVPQTSWNRS